MKITTSYKFDNIILKHNMGNCSSRSELSTKVFDTRGKFFNSPIILSNMLCCQNEAVLSIFNEEHWAYVYHRFGGTQDIFLSTILKEDWYLKSLSVGVKKEDLEFLKKIKKL